MATKTRTIRTESETTIGLAATKLQNAVNSLNDAGNLAKKIADEVNEHTIRLSNIKEEISNQKTELENQKAENKLALDFQFREDQKGFVSKYLTDNGLQTILSDDLNSLREDLAKQKDTFETRLNAEKVTIENRYKSQYETDKKLLESEFKAKEAENSAKIKTLETQLEMYSKQVEMWKSALDAERDAGVKRAQASAVGSITVGSPTGGR